MKLPFEFFSTPVYIIFMAKITMHFIAKRSIYRHNRQTVHEWVGRPGFKLSKNGTC